MSRACLGEHAHARHVAVLKDYEALAAGAKLLLLLGDARLECEAREELEL